MKERPILFSAPMVRALLAGTKTQTRRVVSPQPQWPAGDPPDSIRNMQPGFVDGAGTEIRCPYGQPSDRLWVREAHGLRVVVEPNVTKELACYAESGPRPAGIERWRPSIHMPRWASRITLEVTGVRVQRLREISEADARAEGAESEFANEAWMKAEGGAICGRCARHGFMQLWESINGPGSWDANPWVWAVSFKRVGE